MMVRSRAQSPGSRKAQVSKLRQIMLLAEERPAATGLANGSGSSCSVRRPCRPGDVVVDADAPLGADTSGERGAASKEYPLRSHPSPLTVPACITHREV